MINLSENIEVYRNDLNELVKLFEINEENEITINLKNQPKNWGLIIDILNKKFTFKKENIDSNCEIEFNRIMKKFITSSLYFCLSKVFNKTLPWGALIGVKPATIIYNKLKENKDFLISVEELKNEYYVSETKIELIKNVVQNQLKVIKNDDSYCFYVHIPICPSRCTYCSFVATDFKNAHKYLGEYLLKLREEIEYSLNLMRAKNITINCIYVGGGTPTVLSPEQFDFLLEPLSKLKVKEFTVECGRADTITREKLQALKNNGVTRISINPQTFNNDVLKVIGRAHTAEDVFNAFEIAKEFDFIINMDLIAGLPNDTLESFQNAINKSIAMKPENITVHTLSIKNAGLLKHMNNAELPAVEIVKEMLNYAGEKLRKNGFNPYYLYRQKNMLGFFENVGYSKNNAECLFNIYSMEDMKPVVACGAGAISKKINNATNQLERVANVKQITDYLQRFSEMLERKKYLFD